MSDRIVLKDGTVEESDKIWTSDKYVHFILKGTESVEIRYAIDIVERVERDHNANLGDSPNPPMIDGNKAKPDPLRNVPSRSSEAATSDTNARSQGDRIADLRKVERESIGISFYDPRRSLRYQVSKKSAHNDLQSALNELAKIYGRTPDWVAAYMGEENDTHIIHKNLIDQRQAEMTTQTVPGKSLSNEDNTVSASESPPAQNSENNTKKQVSIVPMDDPELNIHKGIKFYDPRRKRKYWTGKSTHHNSLQDALMSLARQYSVTPKWIEDHMGESNLLVEIHRSIRSSLPRK